MSFLDAENGAVYSEDGTRVESEATPTAPVTVETPAPVVAAEAAPVQSSAAPVTQEINWESVLSEKTGGKYKSWDEIVPKINQDAPAPYSFANDESKRVADYISQGKIDDVYSVLHEQRRLADLDKMDDAQALKLALEYKNPNFTAEDIHEEVASRYQAEKPDEPVEDDYLDEDAFKLAKKQYDKELGKYEKEQKRLDRQLKLDAQAARETLASYKKDIILPEINPAAAATQDGPSEEDIAAIKKMRQDYLDSLTKTSAEFKEIPFEVNDEGVTFKGSFQIEDSERAALAKDLAEKNVIDDILLPRYDKGGVYDTKQLMEDIYWLNNKEKIIKNYIRQAIAQTSLDQLKELKNIDLNQANRGVVTGPSPEQDRKEFAKLVFGD